MAQGVEHDLLPGVGHVVIETQGFDDLGEGLRDLPDSQAGSLVRGPWLLERSAWLVAGSVPEYGLCCGGCV